MKKYIRSYVYSNSYLLDRKGHIRVISLHVPSTTYVNRGITRLCPTDAEFLLNNGKITEDEAKTIALYDFTEFLGDKSDYSPIDLSTYLNFAELKYAPSVRSIFLKSLNDPDVSADSSKYDKLNEQWYNYLCNEFVKVSEFGKTIEFRISSNDDFDWNKVIIDDVLLKNSKVYDSFNINIVRESDKGYKAYFLNASLSDILNSDNIVLSSTCLNRKIVNGELEYSTTKPSI